MKALKLPTLLSSLSVAILTITSTAAYADEDDGDNDGPSAALIVSLEARTKLSPPVAPAVLPGPTGAAEVEARNVDGVTSAEVEVSTRGLAADTYTVAVTKKSDGSAITLGTFTVAPIVPAVTTGKDRDARDGKGKGKGKGKIKIKFSTKSGTLPAGFDAFDVATLTVSGSKGEVALGGDLTQSTDLVKRARLVADASVPTASGYVSLFSATRAGVVTAPRFSLLASGFTPADVLQLAIDGADVQAVTPDKNGRINVRSLPATVNIPGIKKVAIHNAANVNLLSVSF